MTTGGYDTVIIGSGASGLCAALTLARHGQRVALVEQHEQVAPLLRRFRRDGLWCDVGLHYVGGLHASGPLSVIFRYLGLADLIQARPLNVDGYDILHVGDREPIRLPVGTDRVRETLVHHFPRSRDAIDAYVDRILAIQRNTPFLSFSHPGDPREMHAAIGGSESLAAFLDSHGAEPDLQRVLSRVGFFLYGMEAHECPLVLHAIVLGSFFFSAQRLTGGGDGFVHAFEHELAETGVEIFCGRRVVGVETDAQRRLRGVRLAGDEVIECHACVCTIHPHLLPNLLAPRSVRPSFLKRLSDMENTFGIMAVYLEIDDPPDELRASNVYFLGDEQDSWRPEAGLAALACGDGAQDAERRSLSLFRPLAAPASNPGTQRGHRTRDTAYGAYKRSETERNIELFLHHYPSQRGGFRVLDAATPSTFESYTGTVAGAAYGLKHSTNQWGLQATTPIKDLYLAGQSVLAPGLLGAMISSLLAVSHILGHETVWNEIRKCR